MSSDPLVPVAPVSVAPAASVPLFSRRTFLLILCAICVLRLVLNAFVPLMDPSEARYALICKIMSESGNFLEPQLILSGSMVNFEGKPPLCFQAGAVACRIFGVNPFAVRLPSFLFAAGLLAMMYGTLRRIRGKAVAQLAVLLTLSSPIFLLYAGQCMTDMALAFCVCSAVFAYILFDHETIRRNKKLASIGFFAALGLGMLVKGPVALVMAGLPVFLFVLLGNKRLVDLKNHAWIFGFAFFFLIAAPWYVMMQRANPDFLEYFFVNENFKRFLFKEYGDRFGAGRETFRGIALVWFLLSNLPAVLLAFLPVGSRDGRRKLAAAFRKESLADDLPMLGFVFITLFWCLTSRVLITYVLPTVPFFSVWLADRLTGWGFADRAGIRKMLRTAMPVVWCAAGVAFASFRYVGEHWSDKMSGEFFKEAAELVPDGTFYFYRDESPFSAYFYLCDFSDPDYVILFSLPRGGHSGVVLHPKEDAKSSESASRPYYLVALKHNLKRFPLKKRRSLLLENDLWALYEPLEKNEDWAWDAIPLEPNEFFPEGKNSPED